MHSFWRNILPCRVDIEDGITCFHQRNVSRHDLVKSKENFVVLDLSACTLTAIYEKCMILGAATPSDQKKRPKPDIEPGTLMPQEITDL